MEWLLYILSNLLVEGFNRFRLEDKQQTNNIIILTFIIIKYRNELVYKDININIDNDIYLKLYFRKKLLDITNIKIS